MAKKKIKVVLLENVHQLAVSEFEQAGFTVEQHSGALAEAELIKAAQGAEILGIRSGTKLSASFFAKAPDLLAVGAFCIGTNQIDRQAANKHGVAIFNAPYSNTRSVVELAVGNIITLCRRLGDKNMQMHQGIWVKSASGSHEIRGRKLGIIGYGNIGTQLSVVAEALGMEVYYYDVADKLSYGNARKCTSMEELLGLADVVTVHVDGRKENRGLIGAEEFAAMRPGTLFMNSSRGMVVDGKALADAVGRGHLAGAAADVFEEEPRDKTEKFVSALQGLPNVVLTPHIGSGTEEAQADIGDFVARKLLGYMRFGDTSLSVNLPQLALPEPASVSRIVHMHQNIPGMLAAINAVLAEHGVNIDSQNLGTRGDLGYVVTDINTMLDEAASEQLGGLPETIRFRTVDTLGGNQ